MFSLHKRIGCVLWIEFAHREEEKEQETDPEKEVENMVNNLTEACDDDLGLDQCLDGYDFEDYNPEDGEDGNNQVPSTSERGSTSDALSTANEDDDLNLDDLY